MDEGFVLVIGSAGINIKGRPEDECIWGQSNLGYIRNSVGGVARNIAENLARLEVETVLLTALGADLEGERVLQVCRDAGINCDYVRRVEGVQTGVYMALMKADGELEVALSDFEVMKAVDADYLLEHESLFAQAAIVVIDATLSSEALHALFDLCDRYHVRVCGDPTTPTLASRFCEFLPQFYLLAPNASETHALCGLDVTAVDRDTATAAARQLVTIGVDIAAVTMGERGLAYAYRGGSGFIRARKTEVVDTTGAGDAFTGAVIFGLLNEVEIDEAMRLGVTAASLTLESRETVLPYLSQELLYDELAV
ncbi:MAG: ribokinase [Chloroflexi bacterium]|nr:MAG: ribokinase [Chloroflexota bacterium]